MSRSRRYPNRIKPFLVMLLTAVFYCGSVTADAAIRLGAGSKPQATSNGQGRRRNSPPAKPKQDAAPLANYLGDFQAAFTQGHYEQAFLYLADLAGFFYDQNNFPAAMQVYQVFANFADPFTTIDPADAKAEAIRKSTVLKDMSRNYAKFMMNTLQVRPEICRANDCWDLGWEMTEKIKSRLLRAELINSTMSRLDQRERQQVEGLLARVKQERIERAKLRVATGHLLGPTEKDETIAALDSEIARYLPVYTALAGEMVPLRRVRAVLADNETLLSFVYTNNHRNVYVWKLQKDDPPEQPPTVIKTEITTEALFTTIERLKAAIASGYSIESVSADLNVLYRGLVQPLKLSPRRRLIIAVDQNLSALPFDIVPWGTGGKMMDSFDITYIPSATVFYYVRQKRLGQSEKQFPYQLDYAGFGYAGGEGDELTHTETEVENAARSMPRNVNKPNSTEAEIYRQSAGIANARFLHFATHNYLVKGEDASFYLPFGKGEGENGRLTSEEIVTRLHNRAELAVLSSCETAPANDTYYMGQITPMDPISGGGYRSATVSFCICSYGESFSNLTGAFFAAGSKRLLLTQWRIRDDAVTDVFISKLFKLLAEEHAPADALKEVKRQMRAQKPVYWAGFILASD